jgi:putative endopeptidase
MQRDNDAVSSMQGRSLLTLGVFVLASSCAGPSGSGASSAGVEAPPPRDALPMPIGLDDSAMDPTVAPCDDFYRFACGRWIDGAEIRNDFPLTDRSFIALSLATTDKLRVILDDAVAGKGPPGGPVTRVLGDFYGACTDEGAYQDGPGVVRAELKQVESVRDASGLAKQLATLHLRGGQAFFAFGSAVDPDSATAYVAEIDQGGLELPTRDYYFGSDEKTRQIRDRYRAFVERVFVLLGESAAAAAKTTDAVMAIETALAKAALGPVERRDARRLKNRFNLAALRSRAPGFPWQAFFQQVGAPAIDSLNVVSPQTLNAFEELLRSTPWPMLRAYVRWRIVVADMDALPKEFRDAEFEFERLLTGAEQPSERWRDCTRMAEKLLRDAVGQAYVARYFLPLAKQRTGEMATAIAAQFRDNLGKLSWMDNDTRNRALEKLEAFVLRFGYPDSWRSHDDLSLDRSSFLASWRRSRERETRYSDGKIAKPVDRREWSWPATTINMGNSLELNALTFPAAVLQPPIFDVRAPAPVVFGSAGVFIGHEFTHGFDDQGRQFDALGGTNPWWTDKSNAAFHERAACLKEQFDKEQWLDDVPVNGALTLGENIADLGGAKLAYAAMTASRRPVPEARTRYTDAQQFFLGYAQVWCSKYRPEFSRMVAQSDPHSPPALRVNMPLRNMPEFQQAFACPASSKMVRAPKDRCDVW